MHLAPCWDTLRPERAFQTSIWCRFLSSAWFCISIVRSPSNSVLSCACQSLFFCLDTFKQASGRLTVAIFACTVSKAYHLGCFPQCTLEVAGPEATAGSVCSGVGSSKMVIKGVQGAILEWFVGRCRSIFVENSVCVEMNTVVDLRLKWKDHMAWCFTGQLCLAAPAKLSVNLSI